MSYFPDILTIAPGFPNLKAPKKIHTHSGMIELDGGLFMFFFVILIFSFSSGGGGGSGDEGPRRDNPPSRRY